MCAQDIYTALTFRAICREVSIQQLKQYATRFTTKVFRSKRRTLFVSVAIYQFYCLFTTLPTWQKAGFRDPQEDFS